MIMSKTPFRISFCGGATDCPAFYKKEPGAVTGITIDKYMYVTVNKYFEDKIIAKYSQNEIVSDVNDIKNEVLRESLILSGIKQGVEVTSMADVVGGTGLGSSSSYAVGTIHSLNAYLGKHSSPEILARAACKVEIDMAGHPIGKQDQYFAAYGGVKHFIFHPDETVDVEPVILSRKFRNEMENNLCLFYTGVTRDANVILQKQKDNTDDKRKQLQKMRNLAGDMKDALHSKDLTSFGTLLHQNWLLKKQVAGGISNPQIDKLYETALRNGALGGKILGAGGGGFFLFYVDADKKEKLKEALGLKEEPFSISLQGSRIVYFDDNTVQG